MPIGGSKSLLSLSCGIPEAPITTVQLQASRASNDVRLTPSAPVTIETAVASKPQITAALGPRTRLELRWRWDNAASPEPPPLLRASSQVTAEVEPEGIQIKTELRIQSLRGSQNTIELRNSPEERAGSTNDGWKSNRLAVDGRGCDTAYSLALQ